MAGIVTRLAAYTKLSVNISVPGLLFAVAVVLFQAPTSTESDTPALSPARTLVEWSSVDGPISARLEKLRAELASADAVLQEARNGVVVAARIKGGVSSEDPAESGAAVAALANARANANNQQALWNSVRSEIDALRTRRGQHVQTLAERLIGNVIALGVLSLAIGTLLRPLNMGLLGCIERVYAWKSSETPVDVSASIRTKKITEDDYNMLLDQYYVSVETTLALCAPVLLLCLALSKWWSVFVLIGGVVVLALLVLGYVLYVRFDERLREAVK